MNRTVPAALLAAALFASGCATSDPRPSTTIPAAGATTPSPAIRSTFSADDAAQYRRALEEAYAQIEVRSSSPANAPRVDVDAGLSIPIPEHPSIHGALNYFSTDLHDSIQVSLLRSARYRQVIDRVLEEYKLPRGLAYLPVIESAYVPTLTSRAGAHGIWQFMPETAREYNLRVDWWVDERADPERSTRAAATYLRDLYRQFNDWPLTLAAYNAGPGRIRRAMQESGATSFWQLSDSGRIPKETQGYVPTFFATLIIASEPEAFGFKLSEPLSGDDAQVEMDGPVSLRFVAEAAGLDESEVRDLNPAFRRGMLPPGASQIRLPVHCAAAVAEKRATLKMDDPYIALTSFTLRNGDSLKRLAKAIGTSVDTLAQMNGYRSANRMHTGDSIFLPVRSRDLSSLLASASAVDRYHRVTRGETLYSIAKRYHLTVDELADLNDLDDEQPLRVGQRLRVRAGGALTAGGM
jgi:membrane-bound lytic murein transglycosylase D